MNRLLATLTLSLLMSLALGVGAANATHAATADNPPSDYAVGGEPLSGPNSPSQPVTTLQEKIHEGT